MISGGEKVTIGDFASNAWGGAAEATYYYADGTTAIENGATAGDSNLRDGVTAGDLFKTKADVADAADFEAKPTMISTVVSYSAAVTIFTETGSVQYAKGAAIDSAATAGVTAFFTQAAKEATPATEADYTYTPASKAALYDIHGNKVAENGLDSYFTVDEKTGAVSMKADKTLYKDAAGKVEFTTADLANYVTSGKTKTAALDIDLHVGADATQNNQISMKIDAMSSSGLGVSGLKVDGETDANSLDAIDTIKSAIQKVSTQRSALGAVQNRLEHTINNLDNVVENTTSAESQIRDTDMATEMVKYSNNNILSQAGQAMLAQANQSNQGVLSLLQ